MIRRDRTCVDTSISKDKNRTASDPFDLASPLLIMTPTVERILLKKLYL